MGTVEVPMRVSAVLLAVALAASPVLAQLTPSPAPADEPASTIVYAKKTALVFVDAVVDGETTRPGGSFTKARSRVKFRNLIELRAHFRPELARTASRLPAG